MESFFKKYEKPIWIIVGFVLSILLVLSCAFFANLEELREYFAKSTFLVAICVFMYLTPPWLSMLAIPITAFVYMTRRSFERRQWWIIAVSAILSICTVASQAFVQTHTIRSLYETPLSVAFTLVALVSFAAFAFLLLRPAFYAMESFAKRWFGEEKSAKEQVKEEKTKEEQSKTKEELYKREEEQYKIEEEQVKEEEQSKKEKVEKKEEKIEKLDLPEPAFYMNAWHCVILALVFIVCWLPYIIGFAPGYINIDLTGQLLQFDGVMTLRDASPLVSTGIYGSVFSIGRMIGGDNGGLFAIVIMQALTLASALSFTLYVMNKMRAPRWVVVVAALFYALNPMFGSLVSYCLQDTLHAALFAVYASLFVLYLCDPERFSRSIKYMAALIIFALLVSLTRHNAYFAVLLSMPFLALFHPTWRKRLIAFVPILICILLVPCINSTISTVFNVEKRAGVTSSFSTFYQQSARYALEHPDDIEDWEYEALNRYFDYEKTPSEYQWEVADGASRTIREDADLSDFYPAWFAQGLRHPATYLDAFGELTYGYWSIQTKVDYDRESFGSEQLDFDRNGVKMHDWSYWSPRLVRNAVDDTQEALLGLPFFSFTTQGGLYTWIALIGVAFLGFCRKKRYAVIFLPVLIVMLTLIAGPRNNTIRYFFSVVCATPALMWSAIYFAGVFRRTGAAKHRVRADKDNCCEDEEEASEIASSASL